MTHGEPALRHDLYPNLGMARFGKKYLIFFAVEKKKMFTLQL
jgi:hypothetical protein